MFTGLIEDVGTLAELRTGTPQSLLSIRCTHLPVRELRLGDSVAVDGACLTVTATAGDVFAVEASAETLARTTLGSLRPGHKLHLERALRLSDRLGGHLVLGHVDGVGQLTRVRILGATRELTIQAPPEVARLLVFKGSVAVDGVSLTVNEVQGEQFTVMIIPHTGQATRLAEYAVGQRVNLEGDILGKYVLAALSRGELPGGQAAAHPSPPPGVEQGEDARLAAALAKAGFSVGSGGDE